MRLGCQEATKDLIAFRDNIVARLVWLAPIYPTNFIHAVGFVTYLGEDFDRVGNRAPVDFDGERIGFVNIRANVFDEITEHAPAEFHATGAVVKALKARTPLELELEDD